MLGLWQPRSPYSVVRIRHQKREDITIRGKFGMSGKSEHGIAQDVSTRNAEAEIDTVMPNA